MKKEYMTPEVELIDVELEGSVLQTGSQKKEDGTDEDPSAREHDVVFDDDEDVDSLKN